MYTLIGSPLNRSFRVIWAFAELGVEYEHLKVHPQTDEAKKYNPSGKVPALLVGDEVIIDSVAILQFLADNHGALTFEAGSVKRAQQDSMTQFVNDEFDAILWTAARNSFVLPKERRVPEIKESLRWEFARNLGTLETRLGNGPYLMGDTFTVPDIVLTHCLGWARTAKFDLPNDGPIKDYIRRCISRPAYKVADTIRSAG